jgi:peptidylprolyl isomerase
MDFVAPLSAIRLWLLPDKLHLKPLTSGDEDAMKTTATMLWMAALTVAASAQTQTIPTSGAATSAANFANTAKQVANTAAASAAEAVSTAAATTPAATKTASAAAASTPTAAAATAPWIKLPPGVPKVSHLPLKAISFTLRYEDIKVGTGAVGESGKLWHIKYTGWRAADGVEFDSWDQHTQAVVGKDGKPETDADGKPKMSDPQPMSLQQGVGRVITGFDYGLEGMRVGGKRRIFIPWQLAYGARSVADRAGHPGIPSKSDLIFDVELVSVTEVPAATARPATTGTIRPGATGTSGVRIVPKNGQTQTPGTTIPSGATPGAATPQGGQSTPAQPGSPTGVSTAPAASALPAAAPAVPATTAPPTAPPAASAPATTAPDATTPK